MRLAHAVRVGAWILVGVNLLMGLGAIGILMRMSPAITGIIERNEPSLRAGEDMLAALALAGTKAMDQEQAANFRAALHRAKSHVTETGESAVLEVLDSLVAATLAGDVTARRSMVAAIRQLGEINRRAMSQADQRAQQLGRAGAWGIVFMASCAFLSGMIFIRNVTRRVMKPLEEIYAVIMAQRSGETMRRCTGVELSQDVRMLFTGINEILDQGQAHLVTTRDFLDSGRRGEKDRQRDLGPGFGGQP